MAGPLRGIQSAADLFFFVLPALLRIAFALLVLVLLLLLALALRIALLLLLALLARLVLLVLRVLLVLLRVLVGTHLCISGVRQRNDAGGCTVDAARLPLRAFDGAARRRHRHVGKQFRTSPCTALHSSHSWPHRTCSAQRLPRMGMSM